MRQLSPTCTIAAVMGITMLCATPRANAALVVNQNLGVLGVGTTNITGDTATGANNADIYGTLTNPAANWGNEVVFEFSLTTSLVMTIQSNFLTGDPDVFLLDSLNTIPAGAKNDATGGLNFAFLDGVPPETASLGLLNAGTYFLSVDSFIGFDGGITPGDATFDYDLVFSELVTPTATHLGPLVDADTAFTLDTLGSDFDTELGIWDGSGNLILTNDDETPGSVFQSELDLFVGLPVGTYYVGLGGFDTLYDATGFGVTAGGSAGLFDFNFPGGTLSDSLSGGEVAFFSFDVVPEPSTSLLFGIGIAGLVLRRRRV